MFAPWLRGCLVRLVGSELAGLLRIRVGCTRGTILNAPTEEAGRNLSLASRKTRSWLACSLGQRDTAQQTLDLTAGILIVWRPLAAEGVLREDATRGWR